MRARGNDRQKRDYIDDALAVLAGWTREGREIKRTLRLDDSQHAALTERIKVAADALQVRPHIKRLDGHTQIRLGAAAAGAITESDVTLAARIEDAYRTITGNR